MIISPANIEQDINDVNILHNQDSTPLAAKAMLEKAVAALQADEASALAAFNEGAEGFKDRDLYVFCGGLDGNFTAHPTLVGKSFKDLKDKAGKALGEEIYATAKEDKITEIYYMWPRPGEEEPTQKSTYVTRVSDQVCAVGYYIGLEAVQQFRQFPWPPPRASTTSIIPQELLKVKQNSTQLRDVEWNLSQALKQAGYYEISYYLIPSGFAIVTRIEQIEKDGSPKKEPERWTLRPESTSFTLSTYLEALLFSKPGYYRVIVFAVTPYPLTQSPAEITPEDAGNWLSGGQNRLPELIGNKEFSRTYSCTALIYEFERETESEASRFRRPSRIPGRIHLVKAGIWRALEK
ncbi:MAG: hypothetical protein EA420_00870 [Candidatus Competibacteraceae bacterium]|nr:MAG: hypothetical protein EA420_00870 [Candidatus Competibacteraceae bacterium]